MRTVHLELTVLGETADRVYDTLADLARYSELTDTVRSVVVTPVSDRVSTSAWEVVFRAGLLRWREQDVFDPTSRTIAFQQLDGDLAVFDGCWHCEPAPPRARSSPSTPGSTSGSRAWPTPSSRSPSAPWWRTPSSSSRALFPRRRRVDSLAGGRSAGGRGMRFLEPERERLERLPARGRQGAGATSRCSTWKHPATTRSRSTAARAGRHCSCRRATAGTAPRWSTPCASSAPSAAGRRSLAVATCMHHFSVACLVELTTAGNGFEWAMLRRSPSTPGTSARASPRASPASTSWRRPCAPTVVSTAACW